MLAVVIAFIAIIASVKTFQIKAAMAQGASYQPPPEAVTTVVAKTDEWNTNLNAIGSVAAVQGVTVAADLPGLVQEIGFTSGQSVNQGDVLIRLDTKQERAQFAAAEAQRELARLELARTQALLGKSLISQSTYDTAAATFKSADAGVGQIRATIERKTIRAPFAGVLGIRQVNLGQYLAGGAPIVSLQSLRPVYVNFTVPQQEIGLVSVGSGVQVTSDALGQRPWRVGSIHRRRGGSSMKRRAMHACKPSSTTAPASFGPVCSSRPRSPAAREPPSSPCPSRRSATRRSATRFSSSRT